MVAATYVELWGPGAWKFLHAISFAYPAAPDDLMVQQFSAFFRNLPFVIPCPACGEHCHSYFQSHAEEFAIAMRSGPALQRFLVDLHNDVNKRRSPPVPPMPFETVRQIYTRGHAEGHPPPRDAAQWADPYHNMPRWGGQQQHENNMSVTPSTPSWNAGAAAVLVAAAAYWAWGYYRPRLPAPSSISAEVSSSVEAA